MPTPITHLCFALLCFALVCALVLLQLDYCNAVLGRWSPSIDSGTVRDVRYFK